MNPMTNHLSDDAFIAQIQQAAKTIQPDADFAVQLEHKLNPTAYPSKSRRQMPRFVRILGSVAAVLILVAVGIFYVPPLKAIATEIIGFLTRASSDQRSFTLDLRGPMDSQTFKSVSEAEAAASLDFVEPRILPSIDTDEQKASVTIKSIRFSHRSLLIEYQPLVLTTVFDDQGRVKGYRSIVTDNNMFIWFSQVPRQVYYANAEEDEVGLVGKSAHIEPITFTFKGRPMSGQFLRGIWTGGLITQDELDAVERGEQVLHEAVWVDDGTMQLMWQDETMVYSLQIFKQDIFDLTLEDAIQIVESME